MNYRGRKQRLIWVTLFALSMAFLESAVVVYLRELFYPPGFEFPLVPMPAHIAATEVLREMSTLIMLLATGFLAGDGPRQRFAWFIYSFAVWDICYYVFLKLLLNWPDSWFTWDILFLIPVIWTGPVIAPILVSVTMILLSAVVLDYDHTCGRIPMQWPAILLVVTGSVLIFLSFIWDYSSFVLNHYTIPSLFRKGMAVQALRQYVPVSFNWWLFLAGETAEIAGIVLIFNNSRKAGHALP